MTKINDAMDYLRRNLEIPDGTIMKMDHKTKNILFYGEKWGFCVTDVFCRGRSNEAVLNEVEKALSDLDNLPFKQPTKELLNPVEKTRFD